MVKEGDYVTIFHSIHKVMKAETMLKLAGVDFLLIPAPRQLSADCGLAIRFAAAERDRVASVLDAAGLLPAEAYRRQGDEYHAVQWPAGEMRQVGEEGSG